MSVVVAGLDDIAVLAKAERNIRSLADLDTVVTEEISVDFAKAIVGHTTQNSARLWFAWNGHHIAEGRCDCEIAKVPPRRPEKPGAPEFPLPEPSPPQPSLPVRWVKPVSFDEVSKTAVVPVEALTPATTYRYALRYAAEGGAGAPELGRILATGEFTTVPIAPRRLSVAFGSCHLPSDPPEVSLDRWKALAARRDYDLLLLIGDQIYEAAIEGMGATPDEQYRNRYHQFLAPWPMREVLRRTPTYMIFDDHEVRDDWGTKFPDPKSEEFGEEKTREIAALLAYERFQQAHNPKGLTEGSSAARLPGERVYHYDFRWGPAAFFMLDIRSNRRIPPDETYPVLGAAQFHAFSRWAYGPARQADVVFVVTPVPIAYLPVEEIRRLVAELKEAAKNVAGLAGFAAGGLLGGTAGPAGFVIGALLGAAIGHFAGKKIVEGKIRDKGLADLYENDLADMWTLGRNQPDLCRVLETLFDLANDVEAGKAGPKPRAVFLLSGDVHVGARHRIISKLKEQANDSRHIRNPTIHQLISSPMSQEPPSNTELEVVVGQIKPGKKILARDVAEYYRKYKDRFFVELAKHLFGKEPAKFPLDDQDKPKGQPKKLFRAEFQEMLPERNFGRIAL